MKTPQPETGKLNRQENGTAVVVCHDAGSRQSWKKGSFHSCTDTRNSPFRTDAILVPEQAVSFRTIELLLRSGSIPVASLLPRTNS